MRVFNLLIPGFAVAALALPATAAAAAGAAVPPPPTTGSGGAGAPPPTTTASGGAGVTLPPPAPSTPARPIVAGFVARIVNGVAYAPSAAPIQVQHAIWAGNQIRKKPYIYGGGHGKFKSRGYDCSGSVSYVLHAAGLIRHPMDSSGFMAWGGQGLGQWITVYTNPGHAFVEIAGIRFDTSAEADPTPPPGTGPRWRPPYVNPPGFESRHPVGL